ncbi:MAG TPA: hypothetical protein VJJ20_02450 [Candidatus Paceibacterota bacterium]
MFTVGLGSGLAFVGSYFFDMTVRMSLDSASYALDFLSSGWTAARDLANMAFILILVYIAFMIMFQSETTGTVQMLAWVIFIALIINFSFFLTRVVIDTGNILAVQFYNSIQVHTLQETAGQTNSGAAVSAAAGFLGAAGDTKDLTENIMNAIKFQTLLDTNSFKIFYQNNTGVSGWGGNLIILSFIYIAAGAMYFILAASFLAAGIKFLVRIVVLWFAIIASPFALVARAIPNPKIKSYYDMWQSILISHAFYPAVFLFVFFFINQIMATIGGSGNNSLIKSLFDGAQVTAGATTGQAFAIIAANIANVGIKLGLVVALLYIGMKAADAVGVFGAQAAQKFTNWVSRAGTGAVFGTAGFAGRYTAGLAGQRLAQNAALLGANAKGGAKGVAAGLLLRTGEGLSKRSFDLRGSSAVRSGLGLVGIATNEAGGKGGYATSYANRVKRMTERGEKFKQNKGAYERELKKILGRLDDDEKQNLAQAAKEAKDAQEEVDNFGSGDGRGNVLKAKSKQLKDLMKPHKDAAEKSAGKDFKDDYAKSLTTRGWHNLGGLTSSGIPGYISRADHEAASKLRDSKKEGAKIADLVGIKPTDTPGPGYTWNYTTKRWDPPTPPTPTAAAQPAPQQNQQQNQTVQTAATAAAVVAAMNQGPQRGGQQGGQGSGPTPSPSTGGMPTTPGPLPFSLRPNGPTSPISARPGPSTPPTPPSIPPTPASPVVDQDDQPTPTPAPQPAPATPVTPTAPQSTGPTVASFGRGWTAPKVQEVKGIDKKEMKKLLKKEMGELKEEVNRSIKEKMGGIEAELAKKHVGIPPAINKASADRRAESNSIAERKEWLEKEAKRIMDSVNNDTPIKPEDHPLPGEGEQK